MKFIFLNGCYPYKSEPFVENEICFLPRDIHGYLAPVYAPSNKTETDLSVKTLKVISKRKTSWHSLFLNWKYCLIHLREEMKVATKKKGGIYNVAKAIKFFVVCEMEVIRIEQWLREKDGEGPFLFYAYWMYHQAYIAARLKERFPGSKMITRCHGFDLYEKRHPNGYIPFRGYIFVSANYICPISKDGENYLINTYGKELIPKIRIFRLGSVLEEKGDIKCSKSNTKKHLHIVSCSSMVPVKRLDRLISALNSSKREILWTHFGDGPLMDQLQGQAEKLPSNVQWEFMGTVANRDILKYYQENDVDIFVNTSESEGIPVSIMEALSCGIPVIAPDVGSISEVVQHEKTGFLLDSHFTPPDLMMYIEKFAEFDSDMVSKYRQSAQMLWDEKYNAKKNYALFYDFIKEQLQ